MSLDLISLSGKYYAKVLTASLTGSIVKVPYKEAGTGMRGATNLLEANIFGIFPKASAANVQPIFSYEAMVVETNTAVKKNQTSVEAPQTLQFL